MGRRKYSFEYCPKLLRYSTPAKETIQSKERQEGRQERGSRDCEGCPGKSCIEEGCPHEKATQSMD